MTNSNNDFEILLVEDNESDADLIQEAFYSSGTEKNLQVTVAVDGIEASRILKSREHGRLPNLILLDLNLPRKSGRELIEEIKTDPMLKLIPVVVLTSSNANGDVRSSYCMHANCYITKPFDFEQLEKIVKLIKEFWLDVVRLPPDNGCI